MGKFLYKVGLPTTARISPEEFELLGICFDGLYYYDRCLPMGCAVSGFTFECFSYFLECCTRQAIELF